RLPAHDLLHDQAHLPARELVHPAAAQPGADGAAEPAASARYADGDHPDAARRVSLYFAMAEARPDPDALLEKVQRHEAKRRRGRLKIFFGAAAGVGKTYSMLLAAREQRADGVDVVVGCVETHGRAETAALLEGLEVLAPRTIDHRGAQLRE